MSRREEQIEVNAKDARLIALYRQFSEDMYYAGWMGNVSDHADEFVQWLTGWSLLEPGAAPWEVSEIGLLRELYGKALQIHEEQEQEQGRDGQGA